jgi:Flp pilus assembly protein TadD
MAEEELRKVLELDPGRFDALHDLGLLNLQRQDPARAETYLRRAIEVNAYDAVAQSNLALSLLHQKKIGEAIPHLEMTVDLDPTNATARERLERARQVLATEGGEPSSSTVGGAADASR